MFEATGDSWNCMPGLGYLLKLFVFERDYFWKSFERDYLWLSELRKMCALTCGNLPCPQKFLATRLCMRNSLADNVVFILMEFRNEK